MTTVVLESTKYIMIVIMALYMLISFVFSHSKWSDESRKHAVRTQRSVIFLIQLLGALDIFIYTCEIKSLIFFAFEEALFVFILVNFWIFYEDAPGIVINHMCLLLSIGFIMLQRLDFSLAIRQLAFSAIGAVVIMIIPVFIRRVTVLDKLRIFYAGAGIALLAIVLVIGSVSYGAQLSVSFGGISLQPSEFVKIIFAFYLASALCSDTEFKNVVKVTIVAALYVIILVLSKDLGAALIFFFTYLVVLFVSTGKASYLFAGIFAGALGSVAAYFLFSHVRTRIIAWKDPFSVIDGAGYQVSQSLFAICSGGFFGTGLFLGYPESIPVVEEDFIFSAISEELGGIFAICLILTCVSCFIMFLNIALQIKTRFYKLLALSLGTTYISQVFVMIGGVTKFIPSTGVTLPLVSYGGSSLLSTMMMFAVILGLYMYKESEDEYIQKRKRKEEKRANRRRDRS